MQAFADPSLSSTGARNDHDSHSSGYQSAGSSMQGVQQASSSDSMHQNISNLLIISPEAKNLDSCAQNPVLSSNEMCKYDRKSYQKLSLKRLWAYKNGPLIRFLV